MSLSILESRGHWGIKKGLDNIRALLAGLGSPEAAYPSVLIAGTNGKGSTGAFLAHALRGAGIKVGWTTSPHLVSPAERIWINGRHINESRLGGLLADVLRVEASTGISATYFELMVASALLAFARDNVELALVEVGMGGRLDSTNALNPILTILTNIGLDHRDHLGDTVEAIAAEKLHTARDGRPLVLGPTLSARWLKPLCVSEPLMIPSRAAKGKVFWDHSIVAGRRINLAGGHQMQNLGTAQKAMETLGSLGWSLDSDAVWDGLAKAEWPGRLWKVPGLQNVVFDGAHNMEGAAALAGHIKHCGIRPHIFFCASPDKDLHGMARELAGTQPLSVSVVAVPGRFAPPEKMMATWASAGHADTQPIGIDELTQKLSYNKSDTCIVTGSLYFIGHLMGAMGIALQREQQ